MKTTASTKELKVGSFTHRGMRSKQPSALGGVQQEELFLITRLRWLLAIVTIVASWRVAFHGFINYDDPAFVTANPHVYTGLSLANLKWAFTTLSGDATSYQPLTWLSHQLDCQLFGLQPGAHHLTNLWLHVANALLLFTLLDRLTFKPWRSAAVAALFALHPLHVQTVAWVSERKTLVCTLFWFLAMLAHVRFVRLRSRGDYVLVLLLSTAALLSKPIAVCLPFTLLLLDFWPLEASQRPGRLLLDHTPEEPEEAWPLRRLEQEFDLRRERDLFYTPGHGLKSALAPEDVPIPMLYQIWDVLLYLSGGEGFGLPAWEAMCCGLPVVYTNYSAHGEFLTRAQAGLPVSGILQPEPKSCIWRMVADIPQTVEAVRKLYFDRALARQLGANGREFVQGFTIERQVGAWHETFSQLLCPAEVVPCA